MNITVLFTGGTIGSESNGTYVDVCYNTTEPLFKYYYDTCSKCSVHFNKKTVLNTLSENMIGQHWIKIADEARAASNGECDGIIITHGTDTLAYTAAFLSFVLSDIPFPIMLVSSDFPLENPHANGYENFRVAVDFILNEHTKGVFVPIFDGNITHIHIASRLMEAYPFTHHFMSIGNITYGTVRNNVFYHNDSPYNPTAEELNENYFSIKNNNLANIMIVRPYPDLDYNCINLANKPNAILHGLYHSGTACVCNEYQKLNILNFAEKCKQENIDIYAAPFDTRNSPYLSTKEMVDSGIKILEDISLETAYIKLKIAYGLWNSKHDILDFIDSMIVFEKLIKRD